MNLTMRVVANNSAAQAVTPAFCNSALATVYTSSISTLSFLRDRRGLALHLHNRIAYQRAQLP